MSVDWLRRLNRFRADGGAGLAVTFGHRSRYKAQGALLLALAGSVVVGAVMRVLV